jgi:hypothetical protein
VTRIVFPAAEIRLSGSPNSARAKAGSCGSSTGAAVGGAERGGVRDSRPNVVGCLSGESAGLATGTGPPVEELLADSTLSFTAELSPV